MDVMGVVFNLKEVIPLKINKKVATEPIFTHGGGVAGREIALSELKRTVSTCLLWEDTFYEKGDSVSKRIEDLCTNVKPECIA